MISAASRLSTPRTSNSVGLQPAPTPSRSRPRDSRSSEATVLASGTGWRTDDEYKGSKQHVGRASGNRRQRREDLRVGPSCRRPGRRGRPQRACDHRRRPRVETAPAPPPRRGPAQRERRRVRSSARQLSAARSSARPTRVEARSVGATDCASAGITRAPRFPSCVPLRGDGVPHSVPYIYGAMHRRPPTFIRRAAGQHPASGRIEDGTCVDACRMRRCAPSASPTPSTTSACRREQRWGLVGEPDPVRRARFRPAARPARPGRTECSAARR